MSIPKDNVVGRLYIIIDEILESSSVSAESAFSKVFSIEEEDKVSIFTNYAELYRMTLMGINEVEKYQPKNKEKYINTLQRVLEGLSKINFNAYKGSLSNGMEKFKNHFDDKLMLSLEYCAEYLSNLSDEQDIEDSNIQELIDETNELINYVLSCQLDKELERVLVYHLNSTRESLLKYKLFGGEVVKNSISTTLGTLILNRDKVNNEKDKNIMERVFGIIAKINTVFTFSNNSIKLLSDITQQITDKTTK